MRFFVLAILMGLGIGVVQSASHRPEAFLERIKSQADEGEQVVEHFCAVCHAPKPQIALGAPRQGFDEDWEKRIAKGLDVLLANVAEGIQAMPARGGCFECTDEQLVKAILALVPKTERKALLAQHNKM